MVVARLEFYHASGRSLKLNISGVKLAYSRVYKKYVYKVNTYEIKHPTILEWVKSDTFS